MPRVLMREGASGILRLHGAEPHRHIPDCDLDKALALLLRLYDLRDTAGRRFQDNYWHQGFNWLSSQVGFLYWRACYRFVQYAPLLARCLSGELTPVFANAGHFQRLWRIFHPQRRFSASDTLYHRLLLPAHNRRWAREQRGGLLFYRYGPNDFRTRDILAALEARATEFSFVYSPSAKDYRRRRTFGHPVYFLYRQRPAANPLQREYDLSGLPPFEAAFFQRLTRLTEERMAHNLWEYGQHLDHLGQAKPQLFFGLDDHNEVYPILFACKTLGIPSVGYQLGMYARLQAGYALQGWQPGQYQWYDRVIVWGQYWEDILRRAGRAYPDEFFLLGANKHRYAYQRLTSPRYDPRNILVPYEFFANTHAIGQYITRLLDLGYRVYFKFKPDERPERQLESYCLSPDHARRLIPVHDISDELMAEIGIVAGAMTTLLYDLLPYGKPTWVFDTEFRLLDDMVRDGLARLVRLEELESLDPALETAPQANYGHIFNNQPLAEVLERHVLSRLGPQGAPHDPGTP